MTFKGGTQSMPSDVNGDNYILKSPNKVSKADQSQSGDEGSLKNLSHKKKFSMN